MAQEIAGTVMIGYPGFISYVLYILYFYQGSLVNDGSKNFRIVSCLHLGFSGTKFKQHPSANLNLGNSPSVGTSFMNGPLHKSAGGYSD